MATNGGLAFDSKRNDSNGAKKSCYNGRKKTEKEKLPQELIMEILSWLPTQNLSSLRFVSKTWLCLLTKDPQFAKLQYDRFIKSRPNPSILALKLREKANENDSDIFLATEFESCDMAVPLDCPFYQANNFYQIRGICNGLLCIENDTMDGDCEEVYIWNPLINDHITISCLPAPTVRSPGYEIYTTFAFEFDQDSNFYKVIRFVTEFKIDEFLRKLDNLWTQIGVYTLGVDVMWRTVQVDIQQDFSAITVPCVNGVLHWHKYRPGANSCDMIVTFDLKEEVTGELILPYGVKFNEIVELDGFLGAIDRRKNFEIHVWLMKEYGTVSSWSMLYKVGKPGVPFPYNGLSALGFTHDGEILLSALECITLFNPKTNVTRDLKEFKFRIFRAFPFIGSIISPTLITQAGRNLLEEES